LGTEAGTKLKWIARNKMLYLPIKFTPYDMVAAQNAYYRKPAEALTSAKKTFKLANK
jgi:hypothetical protein